ncbi:MAG: DNA polymerase IV [Phycisphaera sp.]|nr:DNA polymerase IV [Phycisphaera sp.]
MPDGSSHAALRWIAHVDMDAFFASIEQLDFPELRGRPVLVGYDGPRGVVAAASYEARRFGCHSAQPMSIARRRCPDAVIQPVRGRRYRELSQAIFAILDDFSPLVEPLSIDEAFIDLTGTGRLLGDPVDVCRAIRQRIRDEVQLTASVGLAPNKFLAKIASDLDKPDGLTVIKHAEVDARLAPLPIGRLWGVGPVTEKKLQAIGVRTIGDLHRKPRDWFDGHFGNDGERYHRLAHGVDDRPVTPDHDAKSIGHEQTFGADLDDPADVRRILLDHVENVARRIRKHGLRARTITLKIRYGDFETITRSTTLDRPTDATDTLWAASRELFDKWATASFRPVRLIGMHASQLSRGDAGDEQLDLFDDGSGERKRQVDAATDRIVDKFGKGSIRRGGTME